MRQPDRKPHTTLLDGGTGSELRRRGVNLQVPAWSGAVILDHRRLLTAIHGDYIAAGADIITANTFATTGFVLAAAHLGARSAEITRVAIAAASDARHEATENINRTGGSPSRVLIAASLSCYPPGGDVGVYPSPEQELAAYHANALLFVDAGADLIAVEMVQDAIHGARVCRAASASGLPFWLGLSCRREPGTGELVGFDVPEARFVDTLQALLEFHPAAVNIMHSPLDTIDDAVVAVRKLWSGPIGVYPELPYIEDPTFAATLEDPSRFEPVTPDALVAAARHWIAGGATIVGGCCGTTPAHIAALRAAIDTGKI